MATASLQELLRGAVFNVTIIEEESGVRVLNEKEYSFEEFQRVKLFKVLARRGDRFSFNQINNMLRSKEVNPDDIIFVLLGKVYCYHDFLELKFITYWGIHVSILELKMLTSAWGKTRKEIARLTNKATESHLGSGDRKRLEYLWRIKQIWVESERSRTNETAYIKKA